MASHVHQFCRYVLVAAPIELLGLGPAVVGAKPIFTDYDVPGQYYVGWACGCGEQGYAA